MFADKPVENKIINITLKNKEKGLITLNYNHIIVKLIIFKWRLMQDELPI